MALPPGEARFRARDVGPSRVLVVTEPVGADRPARLAAWTMRRLTGPADLESEVRRFRVAGGLALTGLALSLVLLTGNIPFDTQVASVYIFGRIESDNTTAAAAVSVLLLVISVAMLFALNLFGRWRSRHERG